jgi:hypothetical protein
MCVLFRRDVCVAHGSADESVSVVVRLVPRGADGVPLPDTTVAGGDQETIVSELAVPREPTPYGGACIEMRRSRKG